MKKIKITIDTVNDAFDGAELEETARILKELAKDFDRGREPSSLRDYNGNRVGKVEYK